VLADPTWPSDPKLREFVFVALSRQVPLGNRRVYEQARLWWLQMSEQADAIMAAGPLTEPSEDRIPADGAIQRSPAIAVGSRGAICRPHLRRKPPEKLWQLCSVSIEIDVGTGKPRIKSPYPELHVLDTGLALAPLVVSADGRAVYASSANGRIIKYPIPVSRPALARRAFPPDRSTARAWSPPAHAP